MDTKKKKEKRKKKNNKKSKSSNFKLSNIQISVFTLERSWKVIRCITQSPSQMLYSSIVNISFCLMIK